jgi:hypothetical protein
MLNPNKLRELAPADKETAIHCFRFMHDKELGEKFFGILRDFYQRQIAAVVNDRSMFRKTTQELENISMEIAVCNRIEEWFQSYARAGMEEHKKIEKESERNGR